MHAHTFIHTKAHNPPFQMSCGPQLQVPKRILGKTPNSARPLAANQSKHKSAAASLESRDDPCSVISRVCCWLTFFFNLLFLVFNRRVSQGEMPPGAVKLINDKLEPASVLHEAKSI